MFVSMVYMNVDVLYKSEARMLKGMLGALSSVSLWGPYQLNSRGQGLRSGTRTLISTNLF